MKLRTGLLVLGLLVIGTDLASAATKIRLAYQTTLDSAPIFVAIEEGFFKKHGLEVELMVANGAAMISGVVSESIEVAQPTVTTLLQAIDSGLDLVIIAGDNVMSAKAKQFDVVVRSGLSIEKPQDLVGKKVGVNTIGAFLHALFVDWLKRNGVDPKAVTFVEIPFTQMADVLRQGNVDAVTAVEPFGTRIVNSGAGKQRIDFTAGLPEGLPVVVFAAKRSWAAAHADLVRGFHDAIAEGIAFANSHPDAARADSAKYLKMPADVLKTIGMPDLRPNVSPQAIEAWVSILKSQNLVQGGLDPAKIIVP
jgi:NitT/TauT family transport system substrate-binding protein